MLLFKFLAILADKAVRVNVSNTEGISQIAEQNLFAFDGGGVLMRGERRCAQ
jgi:hypothetical protein